MQTAVWEQCRPAVSQPATLVKWVMKFKAQKGAIQYSLPRINELSYYDNRKKASQKGFTTIQGNVEHGEYNQFCGTNGLGIAYSDVMAIQAHDILKAIVEGNDTDINIAYGYYVDRVMQAMATAAKEGRWVKVAEI